MGGGSAANDDRRHQDGLVLDPSRAEDVLAIRDLAISYAHSVDDRDWARFESLFVQDAVIDYTASAGITGPPAQVAAWMPDAMSLFTWCLHTIATHEIRFTGHGTATGRVHVFNRNGLVWEGEEEIMDVGGFYLDEYVRVGEHWRFSRRVEKMSYITGGKFAALVRQAAEKTASSD